MKIFLLIISLFIGFHASAQSFLIASKDSTNGAPSNSLALGGYVKVVMFYDFVGNSSYPAMNVVSVPVGDYTKEPLLVFDALQTRLNFRSEHNTSIGKIKTYIEGDFINNGADGAFKIRHAVISFKRFDIGQTWTTFADEDAWPMITDFDGPPTGIWARQAILRYHAIQGRHHRLAFSIESPVLDYQTHYAVDSVISTANQDIPDVIGHYRYLWKKNHIQVSAVYRNIKYKNTIDTTSFYEKGYGLSAATGFQIFGRDRVHAQYTVGKGISRYLVGFEGQNWDAVAAGNGTIELLPTYGGFFGYDHYWTKSKKFSSTIVVGHIQLINNIQEDLDDFVDGYWGVVNFYWYITNKFEMALEYSVAHRKDVFGRTGRADRIQFTTQYNF